MPTRRGRILLVAAPACYIVARLIGVDEMYVIALAALLVPLAAAAVVRWAEHRVTVRRRVSPTRAFAGAPVRIEIDVRNPGHVPSPPVLIEDAAPAPLGGPIRFVMPAMGPSREERLVAERRPAARGRYDVGPLEAVLVDPFGLASVRRTLAERVPVIVYPPVERLDARSSGGGLEGFEASSIPAHGGPTSAGDEFYAVREWVHGDDLRRIHWASVARTGRLMVRQHEARPATRATVFVDTRAARHRGSGPASSFEWAVSAAASTVWHLGNRGYTLRLGTAEHAPSAAGTGRRAAETLLETLAVARPASERARLSPLRDLAAPDGAGGHLVAILPSPTPDDWPHLARLRHAYGWCGAVLIDTDSYVHAAPRVRAATDQQIADTARALAATGWAVATASAGEGYAEVWKRLLSARGARPSSRSLRS